MQYDHTGVLIRKLTFIAAMIGALLLGLSFRALVSAQSLSSGDLKLLKINVPEAKSIRVNSPYVVYITFESVGRPEIKDACFTWSGDGPHCFKVTDLYYGSPSTMKIQLVNSYPGTFILEAFVLYHKHDGMGRTNVVSTPIQVFPR
jgi:hypothetical protein